MVRYATLTENSIKFLERDKAPEVLWNMKDSIVEVNSEGLGWGLTLYLFICHFLNPDLKGEIFFEKEGTEE